MNVKHLGFYASAKHCSISKEVVLTDTIYLVMSGIFNRINLL